MTSNKIALSNHDNYRPSGTSSYSDCCDEESRNAGGGGTLTVEGWIGAGLGTTKAGLAEAGMVRGDVDVSVGNGKMGVSSSKSES